MALRFWRHDTPVTGTVTTTTTTNTTTTPRIDLTGAYFRDFVDATAFGDTTRTFLPRWQFQPVSKPKGPTKAHLAKIEALNTQLTEVIENYRKADEDTASALYRLAEEIKELEANKAKLKAIETLKEHLDPDQLLQFKKDESFLVKGKTMTYRLSMYDQPRVVEGPNTGMPFCIYARRGAKVPRADELLGMKLYIEANEKNFLKTANPNSESWYHFDPDGGVHIEKGFERYAPYVGRQGRYNQAAFDLRRIQADLDVVRNAARAEF